MLLETAGDSRTWCFTATARGRPYPRGLPHRRPSHLRKEALLQEYARAMQELATEHWTDGTDSSRITWTHNQVRNYFRGGGREHEHCRDVKFARRKGVTWELQSQGQGAAHQRHRRHAKV